MALVTRFDCAECKRPHTEVKHRSGICSFCRADSAAIDKAAHMAKLAALPLEERVRRIEEALYDLNAESRLKALEAGHARYA